MLRVLCACILLGIGASAAACEQPKLFVFPNQKDIGGDVSVVLIAMQDYLDGMNRYVECLQAELTTDGGDAAPALLKTMLARRNADAVGETKALATLFTERVGPLDMLRFTPFVRAGKEDCVTTLHVTEQAVIDARTVLLLEQDGTGHPNLLEEQCPLIQLNHAFGTKPDTPHLSTAARMSVGEFPDSTEMAAPLLRRLCSNEFIYAYDINGAGPLSGPCALGPFFRVSKEQVSRLGVRNEGTRAPAKAKK